MILIVEPLLRRSQDLVLTLESDISVVIKCWVDVEFAVHHNMRIHTGGDISLGKGAIYSAPNKQELNTKISIEAELVGVDNFIFQNLWVR